MRTKINLFFFNKSSTIKTSSFDFLMIIRKLKKNTLILITYFLIANKLVEKSKIWLREKNSFVRWTLLLDQFSLLKCLMIYFDVILIRMPKLVFSLKFFVCVVGPQGIQVSTFHLWNNRIFIIIIFIKLTWWIVQQLVMFFT